LAIAVLDGKNNLFCRIEVTNANPNGLMSIGRKLNGTVSQLVSLRNVGFVNGETHAVTCARSGETVTMTVGDRTIQGTLTASDIAVFGTATAVGLRTFLASTADDGLTTYDDFLVGSNEPPPSPSPSVTPSVTPSPGTVIRVAAAGDICGSSAASWAACLATANLIASRAPDAVLTLGDNDNGTGTLTEFLARFDPRWGPLLPIIHPSVGNHEYNDPASGPGAEGYRAYFPDAYAPATGPLYYGFTLGTWYVVALDTDRVQAGKGQPGIAAGSTQALWLDAALAADRHACVLLYGHHPRWSSPDGPTTNRHGSQAHMAAVWSMALADGADVWLSGHDHDYERFARLDETGGPSSSGIRQFVVGTGGGALDRFDSILPTSEAHATAYGALFLELGDGSYSWEFVDVNGSVLDAGGPESC
jgi:hypothetical protein